ncbi:MAG TPA: ATP-binding protein [Candidatus Binataceae bacterium]|jgi:SpoVK/Ycf46/Vps4 family AAA+-type ATPase|nr:ATP-binding protein [Candidatus Binataceae bacterium]
MARSDLLKRLFVSYQRKDDQGFRKAADEIIEDERKKHHITAANELLRCLRNGSRDYTVRQPQEFASEAPPLDSDRKTPLFTIRRPGRYLEELVLDERVHSFLERVMLEFRSWEILEANGLVPVRRILFCGPSGCGKTVTAEAIASELGLALLSVRFDSVVSSLLGETAANLHKVFDYARRDQFVVLFDEFDAIGRSRDDITEHGEIKRVVSSFLQILDNFEGRCLIIAATNFEEVLDPAIWRRFDDVVRFERPTFHAMRRMIDKRLAPLTFNETQAASLVKELTDSTFADAEAVCIDIRRSCAMEPAKSVTDAHLTAALERFRYRRVLMKRLGTKRAPEIDRD